MQLQFAHKMKAEGNYSLLNFQKILKTKVEEVVVPPYSNEEFDSIVKCYRRTQLMDTGKQGYSQISVYVAEVVSGTKFKTV